MNPKLHKNFSLPWTPHWEKVSENHQILLPRGKAKSFNFPHVLKLTRSHFLAFLYQFFDRLCYCDWCIITIINTSTTSTCEQKPIVKKKHIYETKPKGTIMGDFNLWCVRQTVSQALHKNVGISSLPSSKTFPKTTEHSWTNTILGRGGRKRLLNSSLN